MLTTSPECGLLQMSSNNNNNSLTLSPSLKQLARASTEETSEGSVPATAEDDLDEWSTCSEPLRKTGPENLIDMARKAGVAVGGGAMVGLGLVMIPLPTPFGCVVAGAGMGVLAKEFPAAQQVIDQTRDAVVDVIEKNCLDEDDDDDQEEHDQDEEGTRSSTTTSTRSSKEEGFILVNKDGKEIKEVHDGHPFDEVAKNFDFAAKKLKKSVNILGQKALPVLKSIGNNDNKENSENGSMSSSLQNQKIQRRDGYENIPTNSPVPRRGTNASS
mmetsp:Transcript_18319/g.25830  ORF Transcript_18319/g.25830 Transcript_18319/m.25830 type:complete len:272 (-) Transcript_18319:251-1066(-)